MIARHDQQSVVFQVKNGSPFPCSIGNVKIQILYIRKRFNNGFAARTIKHFMLMDVCAVSILI